MASIREIERLNIELNILRLKHAAVGKKKEYLLDNFPSEPTIQTWCVDLTTDLSGDVGTIEIPNERTVVLIRPGHNGGAT